METVSVMSPRRAETIRSVALAVVGLAVAGCVDPAVAGEASDEDATAEAAGGSVFGPGASST
jgi:hypothetical protein